MSADGFYCWGLPIAQGRYFAAATLADGVRQRMEPAYPRHEKTEAPRSAQRAPGALRAKVKQPDDEGDQETAY
jgi:hypothetical protein